MKRAARRNGIQHPFQISTEELTIRLEMCNKRNNYFRKKGSRYQKKHLLQRVEVAQREGRHEAAKTIPTIIKREQDRDFWRRLNYTCGKKKGGSPTSVQVSAEGDDQYTEYTTQKSVHKAIWLNIHYKQFYLAEETPICQGQLCQDFGYNAATVTAALILGVGLGLIASPTASRLRGAHLVGILHCKPHPLANLRRNDSRHILDDCHVPLDANRSARSIEVGALSQGGFQSVVGPPMYEGIV